MTTNPRRILFPLTVERSVQSMRGKASWYVIDAQEVRIAGPFANRHAAGRHKDAVGAGAAQLGLGPKAKADRLPTQRTDAPDEGFEQGETGDF